MRNEKIDFKKYICYELDKENYDMLRIYIESLPINLQERIEAVNAGISDISGDIIYDSVGENSNLIRENVDGSMAKAIALDDAMPMEKVSFIKMDIEGAELLALKGAQKLIKRDMPTLAICVYHTAQHLWQIPQWIRKYYPAYKLYLRHHTLISTDTVCYGIIKKQKG